MVGWMARSCTPEVYADRIKIKEVASLGGGGGSWALPLLET